MTLFKNLVLTALVLNCTAAMASNISTRVVGGSESNEGDWPWMVKVQAGGYQCGGTLIDEKTILTAAHCLFNGDDQISAQRISVTVGEYDLASAPATAKSSVTQTYVHYNYNPSNTTSPNDIALLRLESNNTTVTPLQRLNQTSTTDAISAKDDVNLLGWGSTVAYAPGEEVPPNFPTILNEATVPLQTNVQCRQHLGPFYNAQSMLCAAPLEGGTDACQGDSGGPLIYNEGGSWKQIGLVSWGSGCATAGNPGVYTRIASYDDWITRYLSGVSIDNPIRFTRTEVNQNSSQLLSISNNTDTETQLSFTLNGSSDFSIDSKVCNTLAAHSSCSIVVNYSPSSESTTQAQFTVTFDLLDANAMSSTFTGIPYVPAVTSNGGGGGSILFIFSIPLLLLRRYLKK